MTAAVKIRGFWNDPDGLSLADVVVVVTLPVWAYVAIKLAIAKELSGNQVDFFLVLSYPLLIAVGGKAIGTLPLPWPRRSGFTAVQSGYYQQPYYYQEPVAQTPETADTGQQEQTLAQGQAQSKPTI